MINWVTARHSAIGLDIGSRAVKAAQCRRAAGGAWSLSAWAQIDRAEPGRPVSQPEAVRIADVLRRQGFRGARCVVAANQATLLSACLDLPPRSSGAPIDQIAGAELGRASKCDPASLQVATWDLPASATGKGGSPCMAVACRTEEIDGTLDALESAGLTVTAVDVQAWALQRACGARLVQTGAVLDLGAGGALLVGARGGLVVFQRHLPDSGLSTLLGAMAARLGVDVDTVKVLMQQRSGRGAEAWEGMDDAAGALNEYVDGLWREVSMSLSYLSQRHAGEPAGGMMVCGGGAAVPGLVERLSQALGMEIEVITPEKAGIVLERGAAPAGEPALMGAVGLAMHPQGGAL